MPTEEHTPSHHARLEILLDYRRQQVAELEEKLAVHDNAPRYGTMKQVKAICALARVLPLKDGQLIYFRGMPVWSAGGHWKSEVDAEGKLDLLEAVRLLLRK